MITLVQCAVIKHCGNEMMRKLAYPVIHTNVISDYDPVAPSADYPETSYHVSTIKLLSTTNHDETANRTKS